MTVISKGRGERMKNLNITFQQTVEACYLNLKVEKPEALDRVALNVNLHDCPEFLMPFKAVRFNDETVLKYRQPEHAVSLQYGELTLNKREFVQLYANLLEPFIKGRDWFLDYHNFYIHPSYIFLDKKTRAASYLYLPVHKPVHSDEEILLFFKKLLAKADIKDDQKFLVNLFQYFERGTVTLSSLYQLMSKEASTVQAGSVPQPVKQPERSAVKKLAQAIPEKLEQIEVKKPQKAKSIFAPKAGVFPAAPMPAEMNEDEIMNALFGEKPEKAKRARHKAVKEKGGKEKKPLLKGIFGAKKEKPDQESLKQTEESRLSQPEIELQEAACEDDHTVVIDDNPSERGFCLRLVFSAIPGAPEIIQIPPSQDFITIGRISRDESRPDAAFPSEFKGVGRRHARLERRGDEYYLADLGSVNHTYLDGEIMIPNRPYRLKSGSEVAFTCVNPITYRAVME